MFFPVISLSSLVVFAGLQAIPYAPVISSRPFFSPPLSCLVSSPSSPQGIGNGLPLAAVVTTPAIASVLSFNTFGGNPVVCAGGQAVLRIIEEEGLQENSRQVGAHLMDRLARLKDKHTCEWEGGREGESGK